VRLHAALRLGVLLLSAAASLSAFGQFQAPTQEELQMTSDPKAPGASAVYLYREEVEDDPLHFRTVYARIKVLTEKGKELATVRVAYQRSFTFNATGSNREGEDQARDINLELGHFEVAAVSGRTIHPDGTVIPLTTSPADLMASQKSGNQENALTFNLPSVEVGSILEYRYQLRYDRFLIPPFWQIQQPYFVHKAHYLFTPSSVFLPTGVSGAGRTSNYLVGEDGQLQTDVMASSTLPPGKAVKQDALGRFGLDITDIPAIPREEFTPPLEGQLYHVDFYYTNTFVQKEYWQKNTQHWNKEADQYTAATPTIRNIVSEAVTSSDSELDKAKRLYTLVQKLENTDVTRSSSFSFVNSSIPHTSLDAVLQNKSGNRKEIALLYLALARAAGLNARPERIASRNQRIFSADYLSASQLDAVVIALNIDGKEVVVDPGEKLAPFQTLHWSHAGAGGIALGADGKVETVLTPLQINTDNTSIRVGSLTISPQGSVSGTLKVGFIGQEALHWRQVALRTDSNELKRELEQIIASQVPAGIHAHIEQIAGIEKTDAQLVAVVQIEGNLATLSGTRLAIPRLFFESRETVPFPADDARALPVDMHYPAQEQEQITYVFPTGFALVDTPQDATLNWQDNAAYKLRSKVSPGSITSARILARGFTFLEAKYYNQLRDFYQKVTTTDQQQLVLQAAKPAGGQ